MDTKALKVIKAVADYHKKTIVCPFCNRIDFGKDHILKSRPHKNNCPTLVALKIMEDLKK